MLGKSGGRKTKCESPKKESKKGIKSHEIIHSCVLEFTLEVVVVGGTLLAWRPSAELRADGGGGGGGGGGAGRRRSALT